MDAEYIREYCLRKKFVTESFPFGESTLVLKVKGKMFLLLAIDTDKLSFNVKCDPERALELRETHSSIQPGFHMNKKYWNTVTIDSNLRTELILEMIDDSYLLVIQTLKKTDRLDF